MRSNGRKRLIALATGVVLGFAACSIAGHLIPQKLENFTRFHIFLSPDSLYYPTVRSVFNAARSLAPKGKPVVVVGGSSVLYGAGQPEGKTIADFLRAELGGDYTVLNLAMRGGDVAGMALFIAEALQGAGYDVFYMADVFDSSLEPTGSNSYYDYIYWQYRSEAFSQAWEPRDAYAYRSRWTGAAMGQRLNSIFRFDDFWTQLGYGTVFTVYSKFVNDRFWQPRRNLRDPEAEMPKGYFYAHADIPAQRAMLVRMAADDPDERSWEAAQASWLATIPERLRSRTLLVLCRKDPRISRLLSDADRTHLDYLYDETERRYAAVGLHAIQPCNAFDRDDYADTTHLAVPGAQKMARELARSVRQLAKRQP